MELSRRSFIRWVLAAGAGMACPVPLKAAEGESKPKAPGERLVSEQHEVCHRLRDDERLPSPAADRKVDLVIVGAGVSGLAAAEYAQKADFVLLEKEPFAGGNAYTETWEGLSYCTGSAWATVFSPEVKAAFERWKFDLKPIHGLDSACIDGTWIEEFWDGNPDSPVFDRLPYPAAVRASFRQLCKDLKKIDSEKEVKRLDAMSFAELLKPYAPEIARYWDTFGPSNWGCRAAETSAYLGVQAARDWSAAQRFTWEGGLGVGSQRIFEQLSASAQKRIEYNTTVYSVKRKGKRVVVSYFQNGEARSIEAKVVVMATPKFITWRMVEGLPEAQRKAMASMKYAPFMMYNLCFSRVVFNQAYDNFVVGAQNFTDFVPADFVTHGKGGDLTRKQVLTVYAPQRDEDRSVFMSEQATMARARAAVDELGRLFPSWHEHLVEVRVHRRGHAMPKSIPGFYTKLQPAARADLGRIFFAHSDSNCDVSDLAYAGLNGIAATKKALALL